ncbi:hypothetical protein [Rickettsia asembonensis]|uniref:hypothetical protein n=1 Tax=Rickettsia asembonensis TaxID=1068590 RepID=UPI0023F98359|nr:hypothetical protein [Rickettsia asembonensis]
MIDKSLDVIYSWIRCHTVALPALLHGSKNALDVIPWLDHGIQKKQLKISILLIFLTGSRE